MVLDIKLTSSPNFASYAIHLNKCPVNWYTYISTNRSQLKEGSPPPRCATVSVLVHVRLLPIFQANVPICISTHLLNSMMYNKVPLRAEVLDTANCILDGADFLLLGPETAIGNFPIETITYLSNACKEAEACVWSKRVFRDFIDMVIYFKNHNN